LSGNPGARASHASAFPSKVARTARAGTILLRIVKEQTDIEFVRSIPGVTAEPLEHFHQCSRFRNSPKYHFYNTFHINLLQG
jgi:hypothetical protein